MHNISESLPLFADLEPVRDNKQGIRNRQVLSRHLRAARRLSGVVRKLPDHSEEQTRAGQAICRHLIALLEEGSEKEADEPDRAQSVNWRP